MGTSVVLYPSQYMFYTLPSTWDPNYLGFIFFLVSLYKILHMEKAGCSCDRLIHFSFWSLRLHKHHASLLMEVASENITDVLFIIWPTIFQTKIGVVTSSMWIYWNYKRTEIYMRHWWNLEKRLMPLKKKERDWEKENYWYS